MSKERIAIVADSCADLMPSYVAEHNITVVPLNVIFGTEMFKDGVDIKPAEFYKKLAQAEKLPRSSQPSPGEFMEVYEELLKKYDKIVSIHLSEHLSGTINSARSAAEDFNGRVFAFDSHSISAGIALQVEALIDALGRGMTFEEIPAFLEKVRAETYVMFTLDTLEYLAKGGRIGKAESLLGNLLNIKPIIIVIDGVNHAFGKVRSQKRALKTLADHFVELSNRGLKVKRLAVAHGLAPEAAESLKADLEERLGIKANSFSAVSSVIGVHTGPGTVGAAICFD